MLTNIRLSIILGILTITPNLLASSSDVTPAEQGKAITWFEEHWIGQQKVLPFSFHYGDNNSDNFLNIWNRTDIKKSLDQSRIQYEIQFKDPAGSLSVTCKAIVYTDYPVVEWTIFIKNISDKPSNIISNFRGIDTEITLPPPESKNYVLHYSRGSEAIPKDYQPGIKTLTNKSLYHFASQRGRATDGEYLPFFNLLGKKSGCILAVGWPGQWMADFTPGKSSVRIEAGQETTHFRLNPGEEFRSPLIALLFHDGPFVRSQNIWRRWIREHNLPRINGKPPEAILNACSSSQYEEMIKANSENQKLFVRRYHEENLQLDYWWMDAGWYLNDGTWVNTGTWKVDQNRFPGGLRPIRDYAKKLNMNTIVWFEPERVTANTELYNDHPEWLLKQSNAPESAKYQDPWRLLDLGNPDALNWLIERVDSLIISEGIDLYRQDFNIQPLYFWRSNDAPDRKGITENKYCIGYLAFWDELRRRHPNMLIDSCASGGRRNDLETIRRSVPLLRSDFLFDPVGQQCQTYGISYWYPFHGTGSAAPKADNSYALRSCMCPSNTYVFDLRDKNLNYNLLRKLYKERKETADLMQKDFYPLTDYSLSNNAWMAWQFHDPETDTGMVQAFRRKNAQGEVKVFQLYGLEASATYLVKNYDSEKTILLTGSELMKTGLNVTIPVVSNAVTIKYSLQK